LSVVDSLHDTTVKVAKTAKLKKIFFIITNL